MLVFTAIQTQSNCGECALIHAHLLLLYSTSCSCKRECEVLVSNLNSSASHLLLSFLQVKILQAFLIDVLLISGVLLLVSLHLPSLPLWMTPNRRAVIFSELVKLFFLVLHLLVPFPQFEIWTPWRDIINGFANVVDFSFVHRDGGVGNLLITDVTGLLQFLVHTLDVFVQVGNSECLATIWALCALVVMHLSYVPAQVAHSKFLLTVRARLLDPFVGLPHVS